ncbi:MAG: 50S ribosomal protein L4 [Phycisphaerae bacterium]|nr:50S ribosomal protein L4 [Phycisphaerae bacterium]
MGTRTDMIEVAVYNPDGSRAGAIPVEEAWFGGKVHMDLLRLAVRRHEANQRVGTVKTKSRAEVAYSTKKLHAQKHTGRARMGGRGNPIRRKGGHAFAKRPRDFSIAMPKKMRRRALDSALLARMLDAEVVVLDGLSLDKPKTRQVAKALKALGADRTCLLALPQYDSILWKSARNLPRVRVRPVAELNAYDVLWPNRVVFTRPAFEALVELRKN